MSLWLIGAGVMAQDYVKVLNALDLEYSVIGRSTASAEKFESATGRPARQGGLSAALRALDAPERAIVAVGVEQLADTAIELIEAGTRRILVEKPGGLNTAQVSELAQVATRHGAEVLIAYNRRFYASAATARRMIVEDGGATSCSFEFTEWSHVIAPLTKGPGVKEVWFLANSTHVVDLAFHLCGFPAGWSAWYGGSLSWHPSAARFCGSGITEKGVLFSYQADWEAPGRWGVEVLTRKRRFVFRPMEQLQVILLGSVKAESVELDDRLDKEFKPGLYMQTKAFLDGDDSLFCSADEQLQHCAIYDRMAGYGPGDSNGS
ncbi:MAG: Myo-inositol 2-dehydrogenase [Rhodocyclaceae bacterium]|nr:MAG: Myo-inositol 2-dehydrogenase [Rhodocyclaceae bacterium]TND05597.1 MAG: Myo-inositol 2-dehydrogenase [Rhodocyclaceae bacterium]